MSIRIPTPVKESDFRLFVVGDEPEGLSCHAAAWLDADQVQRNIDNWIAVAAVDFAGKLFDVTAVEGILQCSVTTRYETDTEWLLLANQARIPSTRVTLHQVADSRDGDFLFLPVRRFQQWDEHKDEFGRYPVTPMQRFFALFGGLRASMPHLGGTYFRLTPSLCPPGMIFHKLGRSERWMGSSIFYVRDHWNYFLVNEQGEVGYIPIDPDLPMHYVAPDFQRFIEMWLGDLMDPDTQRL